MITTEKFSIIFSLVTGTDKFTLDISEPNEENIIEFAVIDKATNKALFHSYDNRIYINANFDLDIHLLGTFESIDGSEKEITFQYDTEKDFRLDIINLLYFYASIR
jgi:hypothetical protein